jgi:hypothetical protein
MLGDHTVGQIGYFRLIDCSALDVIPQGSAFDVLVIPQGSAFDVLVIP